MINIVVLVAHQLNLPQNLTRSQEPGQAVKRYTQSHPQSARNTLVDHPSEVQAVSSHPPRPTHPWEDESVAEPSSHPAKRTHPSAEEPRGDVRLSHPRKVTHPASADHPPAPSKCHPSNLDESGSLLLQAPLRLLASLSFRKPLRDALMSVSLVSKWKAGKNWRIEKFVDKFLF